jgi:hypothetical protein
MALIFKQGSQGDGVQAIRAALAKAMGADAAAFPKLAQGNVIDLPVDAAIRQWQAAMGMQADGVLGPCALGVLGVRQDPPLAQALSLELVKPLFPFTKPANISRYLPYVSAALRAHKLLDRDLVLTALGTIRAETEGFLPLSEGISVYNTPSGSAPFSAYEKPKNALGNTQAGDGARFKGRGFVQLTGRSNYAKFGPLLGIDLCAQPDLANGPEVAACLLAAFLTSRLDKLRAALAKPDLAAARKLVNGGSHGLERFTSVFDLAKSNWPESMGGVAGVTAKSIKRKSKGKGDAMSLLAVPDQAAPLVAASGSTQTGTPQRNARRDTPDLRDRPYTPPPVSLASHFPEAEHIHTLLPRYAKAGLVLNQGQEGACTGFGLASVINFLRWRQANFPTKLDSVSPRMLYNLARRYDEYTGENYEGSSCRGAIKGWFNHGVCLNTDWPYHPTEPVQPQYGYADRAVQHTLGVYYRIDCKLITDLQAAIQAVGAVYASAGTHEGWQTVTCRKKPPSSHDELPVIDFDGKPGLAGGHAFSLVGYNPQGFVVQNSWGSDWGTGGFAVLRYEDWLTNAMDAWVVSLGVPGVVAGRVAERGLAARAQGKAGAADTSQWWSPDKAYQHSVVLGNDGRVEKYLTPDERTRTLAYQVGVLPTTWFRQQGDKGPKRLVIYAHGGLNSEGDAIERARAMGRYFLGNGCYPLFLVWKTGLIESIRDIISDRKQRQPAGAGLLDRLVEASDQGVEKAIGRPFVKPIWSEMKENARLAYDAMRGGDQLVRSLVSLMDLWGDQLEIHLVGHSAGSITLGHMLSNLAARDELKGRPVLDWVKGVHLYAPACTVAFANQHYASRPQIMDRLHVSLLADQLELDDNTVGIYRKSLLYLVANSLEADLRTPILGMERGFRGQEAGWDGSSSTVAALSAWREVATQHQLDTRLNVLQSPKVTTCLQGSDKKQIDAAHGSFDNDVDVVSTTLQTILGRKVLQPPVTDLRGF